MGSALLGAWPWAPSSALAGAAVLALRGWLQDGPPGSAAVRRPRGGRGGGGSLARSKVVWSDAKGDSAGADLGPLLVFVPAAEMCPWPVSLPHLSL